MDTECPMCDRNTIAQIARPDRYSRYGFIKLLIPETLALPECIVCGCQPIGMKEAIKLDEALKLEYAKQLNPHQRWEAGIPHHPKAEALYRAIADLDYNHNDDYFEFKSGGDGDNGEQLKYLLDMYFENEDK